MGAVHRLATCSGDVGQEGVGDRGGSAATLVSDAHGRGVDQWEGSQPRSLKHEGVSSGMLRRSNVVRRSGPLRRVARVVSGLFPASTTQETRR